MPGSRCQAAGCTIQRVSSQDISPEDFQTQYIARGFPVVLLDALSGWPASSKWTLDFFHSQYSSQQVAVDTGASRGNQWHRMSLAQYIGSFQDLEQLKLHGPSAQHPYLRTWNFSDDLPELLEDFAALPHFPDLFQQLDATQQPPFLWLFLGPAGSQTRLHTDIWHTDAWLAQLQGSKRFTLYHPDHRQYLERGDEMVDITAPDLDAYPDFPKAQPVQVILGPGEVLYIPRRWPHHAVSLQPTVSLTSNFLSRSNRRGVLPLLAKYMQRRSMCERILRRPLRASDNLMKFCCHGGRIPARLALQLLQLGDGCPSADATSDEESDGTYDDSERCAVSKA